VLVVGVLVYGGHREKTYQYMYVDKTYVYIDKCVYMHVNLWIHIHRSAAPINCKARCHASSPRVALISCRFGWASSDDVTG